MKKMILPILLIALLLIFTGCEKKVEGYQVGIGVVDITPQGNVAIAGNSEASQTTAVDFSLYAKAMVLALGEEKMAIVTLDTLKYPTELAVQAMEGIAAETGIPADQVMIVSSHTHSGPLYASYDDLLVQSIVAAVKLAAADLEPCQLAVASTTVSNVASNRRLMVKGEAWNAWMIPTSTRYLYTPEGPSDPQLQVLVATKKDGTYKTILWNYACHANSNNTGAISGDFPSRVQEYLNESLGYETQAMFLPGACGDVNPNNTVENTALPLGDGILECLKNMTALETQFLSFETMILDIPKRENPVFEAEDIQKKWPDQYAKYESYYNSAKMFQPESYKSYICLLKLGDTFAMITNPGELFCQYGLDIKAASPYAFTMSVEQTNGAVGYIPTLTAYANKSYETWYGEHSNISVNAGEMIRDASIEMLKKSSGE